MREPAIARRDDQSLGMEGRHWRRLDAIKHPLFWVMVPQFWAQAPLNGLLFHKALRRIKGWAHLCWLPFFRCLRAYGLYDARCRLGFGSSWDRTLDPLFQVPLVLAFLCFCFCQ